MEEENKEVIETKVEERKEVVETKKTGEKGEIVETKKIKEKKEEVKIKGYDLDISTKHAIAICRFIKGKSIENAIKDLEDVIKKKKAIPMKGEIPHRKGMERGRYPTKATKTIIKLLKSLNANASILGIENPVITLAKADKASRPYRRWGSRRFKRTHISIVAKNKLKEK